jgi:hypothetical protein
MKSTITFNQQNAITTKLEHMVLPAGIGTVENACSIAAINLALTNELTDNIPNCMSMVLGKWIIRKQDRISDEIRNSREWKVLLPLAAGTGRERELDRMYLILEFMWNSLAQLQPLADKNNFGDPWKQMALEKTESAVEYAESAVEYAKSAAEYATKSAEYAAAKYAESAKYAEYAAVEYAEYAVKYAEYATSLEYKAQDPCEQLARLIFLDEYDLWIQNKLHISESKE